MVEYTPDQLLFVERFTAKRDSLTLEVGLLTHEFEQLSEKNQNLSASNAILQQKIDDAHNNAARIGFEEAEKIHKLKQEAAELEALIAVLREKKEILTKATEEQNNTLIALGLIINTIKSSTEDTVQQIRSIKGVLDTHSSKVEKTAEAIGGEAGRVKSFIDEFSNVIDKEREKNYLKNKELDDRENAIIGRERFVEMKYAEMLKNKK